MCISPILIKETGVLVGCRNCWQCRSNQVANWVGRNIAETTTAAVSYAVTLTYGRDWDGRSDHIQSVQLMKQDIQRLLKRMRKKGQVVRYMVAGEYGSALGRAHWHGIFHFYGDVLPEWEGSHLNWSQEQWDRVGGVHIPEWSLYDQPLGHVHIKKATYAHVRYALKYLMKDQADPAKHGVLLMSKKPPIGWVYFMDLARETAQAGLPIHDLKYYFDVRTMAGEQKRMSFMLNGRMAEMYLQEYIDEWHRLHGNRDFPASESGLVETFNAFGRIGDEVRMTEVAQEKLAREFEGYGDQKLKPVQVRGKRPKLTLKEYWKKRDEEFKVEKAQRLKRKRENGPEGRQRQRINEQRRRDEAVRVCLRQANVTAEYYYSLPKPWRELGISYPARFAELISAKRKAAEFYGYAAIPEYDDGDSGGHGQRRDENGAL